MKLDTLTKLNNKKKMWISPKHPLYFETVDFKVRYGAGIFVHAQANHTVNTLNNFELQRLLTIGLGLEGKDIAKLIHFAQVGERIVDDVIGILDEPLKKLLYLMDLVNVSMRTTPFSEIENQSIRTYVEFLHIEEEQYKLLYEFVKAASTYNSEMCIKVFEQMLNKDMNVTMSELKYYIPEIAYITKIDNKIVKKGSNLRLVDNCEIRDTIVVPSGTTLNIANAVIQMYGTIVVDGGVLIIRDSKLINRSDDNESMIVVKNFSEVEVYNSELDCKYMGSAIYQDNGKLICENSKIYHTTKTSAIRFWGTDLQIQGTSFCNCYTLGDGAAVLVENGSGIIKSCTFKNCEASNGGAIYCNDGIMIMDCTFHQCNGLQYGAAIYYNGEIKLNITNCDYDNCLPEKEEVIQYLGGVDEYAVHKEYTIKVPTILDKPICVEENGLLTIIGAKVYINKRIDCKGLLSIKNSHVIAGENVGRDVFVLIRARGCKVENSEFDGRLRSGIFRGTGTRIMIESSIFRNTANGRAVFDPFEPIIKSCIFSYCLNGGISSCSGTITDNLFVNCRGKSGAGVLMYGTKGEIKDCKFIRCVADYSGGAIDMTLGNIAKDCDYDECKPDNIS